ncbi:hypothetical protein [Streptomyces sp. BE133]|uniref:hypothetical protein n=1 Tax=Streptomyces sp. BE133 TaxID=3002523 RepID=UPI002E78D205|nr:hypothetical protein [Streptomyces sp. BE133]MEE1804859.1 hypothetical protein [Streptomyces sp. BE133]
MTSPARHEVNFPADHHQYWMIGTLPDDEEVLQPKVPKGDNFCTLDISRKGRAGHVGTNTQYGDVRLVFEFHQQAPSVDTTGWREVVEGSMRLAGEILLDNPANEQESVPVPGEAAELSWWRVRVHVSVQTESEGLNPPGVEEMQETHLIQLWPSPKSRYMVVLDRPEAPELTEADECLAGSASIAFREPSHSITLYLGDGAPQTTATGEVLGLSPDGRGARIATQGWGEKSLYGTVAAFTRALPSEARKWEIEAEFTLTGAGGQMRIVPDEDEEYADTVSLPDPGLGNRWHVIVYVRGRDPRSEDGEYYVTVWPEA